MGRRGVDCHSHGEAQVSTDGEAVTGLQGRGVPGRGCKEDGGASQPWQKFWDGGGGRRGRGAAGAAQTWLHPVEQAGEVERGRERWCGRRAGPGLDAHWELMHVLCLWSRRSSAARGGRELRRPGVQRRGDEGRGGDPAASEGHVG